MNLQNLPRGGELRKSLLAPDGYVLVVSDSAQIEARTLAWLADDQEVLNQFAAGEDVYKIMAAKIYNKDIADITKAERFVGKVAILGLGYGMGWRKFLMTITLGLMGPKMQIEPEEAQAVVNTYRRERRAIPKFWEVCTDMLLHMLNDMDMEYSVLRVDGAANRIYLPNGMYLEYPGLCQSQDGFVYFDYENAAIIDRGGRPNPRRARRIYGGLLAENITQAIARIIVGEQLLTIAGSYRVATTTHDEIVSVAPETDADEALEFSLTTMRTPPAWASNLPLNAEGGWAREYSK
jgi:hypothetical protein